MSTRWCIDGFLVEADSWGDEVALSIEHSVIAHVPSLAIAPHLVMFAARATF